MDIDRHTISENATLLDALARLNGLSGSAMTLFALDGAGGMVGTLTDGDVRRGLLRGLPLHACVSQAMRRDFGWLDAGNPDAGEYQRLRARGVRLVPLLDAHGRVSGLVDAAFTKALLPLSAIVMAGGKGERLRPLTLATPKPLLPVGGKPIIDYNIDLLRRHGINDITVTVNYLAEQIESHFEGTGVKCVREPAPLGTIGAAALADLPAAGATVVMNSDLLTTVSLEEMWMAHTARGAAVTIAALPYSVAVPYAILSLDGDRVTGLEEKPTYSFLANGGIYIFDNSLLRGLPTDRRTDATDLIDKAISEGLTVTYCPIKGTWIDIGTPNDYKTAQQLMGE